MDLQAELVVDARATLGEGPVWDDQRGCLFWVDIEQGELHAHEPAGQIDRVYDVGGRVGAAVLTPSESLILATADGFEAFDLETGRKTPIADPESQLPGNRFNDGKCDPAGRFWAGTMGLGCEPGLGALYVLERDRSVRRVRTGVSVSNGLDWSLDHKTMYYIDSPTHQVLAFDYDAARGAVDSERVVIEFPEGAGDPDGMTIDAEGMLWIAHWGGGRISRWDPDAGKQLATVRLPPSRVTSCAFGGADLATLYITTARHGLEAATLEQQPTAGGLFAVRPPVAGVPCSRYPG